MCEAEQTKALRKLQQRLSVRRENTYKCRLCSTTRASNQQVKINAITDKIETFTSSSLLCVAPIKVKDMETPVWSTQTKRTKRLMYQHPSHSQNIRFHKQRTEKVKVRYSLPVKILPQFL
jgi:hypothetical protein